VRAKLVLPGKTVTSSVVSENMLEDKERPLRHLRRFPRSNAKSGAGRGVECCPRYALRQSIAMWCSRQLKPRLDFTSSRWALPLPDHASQESLPFGGLLRLCPGRDARVPSANTAGGSNSRRHGRAKRPRRVPGIRQVVPPSSRRSRHTGLRSTPSNQGPIRNSVEVGRR
jgi:hypothetical protein